jgi:hypothetical protein
MSDFTARLRGLGLCVTASTLDDIVATATKKRWSATELLEYVVYAIHQ